MFDGSMIFTSRRINPHPMELFSQSASGENVRIMIRLVGDVAQGDYHLIQFFNIILRKCLVYMKLQLVGRNFYDPQARVSHLKNIFSLYIYCKDYNLTFLLFKKSILKNS